VVNALPRLVEFLATNNNPNYEKAHEIMSTSDITATDNFCGAGGSTTGLKNAGIRVVHAANHWQLAIESHNTNHPETDHSCVDISATSPGWFPTTTVGWFSIECQSHSPAGGRRRRNLGQMHLWENKAPDPTVERSRMTAWDVVRFSEYHKYSSVIVENVVEYCEWELYDIWISAMRKLGYQVQIVCFNSQFSYPNSVPQSRDRIYVIFHRTGNKAPNVNFCPPASCPEHGEVLAVQSWKNPLRRIGKYGTRNQYVYTCPVCAKQIVPHRKAAREALNLLLPTVKIGDRQNLGMKPLSENTIRRIEAGLNRFTAPFIATARSHNVATSIDDPICTVTTGRHHALINPPGFLTAYHGGRDAIAPLDQPSWTVATNKQFSLVKPPAFLSSYYGTGGGNSIDNPSPTMRTTQGHALIEPDFSALVEACGYRMIKADEAKRLMGFPDSYIILGNQQEQFKQAGNAVTPGTAEMIGRAVIESFC
jgi:DNA (cytosine-5)-methyltransferase 1